MKVHDKILIQALGTSVTTLQRDIDAHCSLVASFLEVQGEEHSLRVCEEICHRHSREVALENAIKDAIEALERSRKAFKSRQLETLRTKLMRVLTEWRAAPP